MEEQVTYAPQPNGFGTAEAEPDTLRTGADGLRYGKGFGARRRTVAGTLPQLLRESSDPRWVPGRSRYELLEHARDPCGGIGRADLDLVTDWSQRGRKYWAPSVTITRPL